MRELERRVGVSFSGIAHHVHNLESEGVIVSLWDGHFRRWFSRDLLLFAESRRLGEEDRRLLAACRRPAALSILLNLAAAGSLRHKELLGRVGKSKSTLTYHLEHLISEGLVRVSIESSERRYELVDRDRSIALLVTFAETYRSHADGFADLWLALRKGGPASRAGRRGRGPPGWEEGDRPN